MALWSVKWEVVIVEDLSWVEGWAWVEGRSEADVTCGKFACDM